MRRLLAIVSLLAWLPAAAQTGPRQEAWQRTLASEPALIARVEAMRAGLEVGDLPALRDQFAEDRVGLLLGGDGLRLTLLSPSHAGLLLGDYLRRHPVQRLRTTLARFSPGEDVAHIALDAQGEAQAGGIPRSSRFVASFRRAGEDWRLTQLLCP
jgi:hypothetical protein